MLPSVLAGKVVSVNNTNHNTNKKTYSNRIKNKPKMGVMARSSIQIDTITYNAAVSACEKGGECQ